MDMGMQCAKQWSLGRSGPGVGGVCYHLMPFPARFNSSVDLLGESFDSLTPAPTMSSPAHQKHPVHLCIKGALHL
eukprot:1114631-Pelagomonas_calceolata.AAC.4